jgi:hypothetical protein
MPGRLVCGAHFVSSEDIRAATAGDASGGLQELYKARQEMLAQQLAARNGYHAKAESVMGRQQTDSARIAQATVAGEQAVRTVFDGLTTLDGGVVAIGACPCPPLWHATHAADDHCRLNTTSRTFTREEVLTVLKAQRAVSGGEPGEEAVLNRLRRIFERME